MLLCQFFVLAENRFWFFILLCTKSIIQLWCCVIFFWFWREIVFGVMYILRVQYSCAVVSFFFVVAGKLILYKFSCSIRIFFFFCFWRELVFGVTYILSVQYSCAVVSVFLLWQES